LFASIAKDVIKPSMQSHISLIVAEVSDHSTCCVLNAGVSTQPLTTKADWSA